MCVTQTACPSLKNSFIKEYTGHNFFDYEAMKHYFPRVAIVPTSPLLPVFLTAQDPARCPPPTPPHPIISLSASAHFPSCLCVISGTNCPLNAAVFLLFQAHVIE